MDVFRQGEFTNESRFRKLIDSLERRNTIVSFENNVITETISEKESLVDVLPKVRASRMGLLPVVSKQDYFIGIVTTSLVERKISDEVLATQNT